MTEDTAATPTVAIEGLTVSYRRRGRLLRVLSDLSLRIEPGEAFGLVGESGCGKTTVAMSLMRYLPANAVVEAGRIGFQGRDLLSLGPAELRRLRGDRMAMVYQDPGTALNPTLRIGTQIAEVYRHHRGMGRPEALEAAAAMLGTVRVADPARMLRRYPHELSGGQQQRVMLAMALATDPDLLVLDEPTTGLDATVEAEVLDLVEQLRDRFHAAILFVSHNLGVVARMCERVGVLYAGRLIEQAPARDLFEQPRHPYTLALLRCVPRLGMRKDTDRLEPIPGSLPPLGVASPGCVYADRCPIARERCDHGEPPLAAAGNGLGDLHLARCLFPGEVAEIPASTVPAAAGAGPPTAAHNGLLRLETVVKAYRSGGTRVVAVDGVDLEIGTGEVVGLVGESGSGKTSLARLIVGIADATAGTITLASRPLGRHRDSEQRRAVQIVFQNPEAALNPRRTVRGILAHVLRRLAGLRRGAERERRLGELAAAVRLEPGHLDQRPPALSGGLKQRVAIARSFAGAPALVLCDEPTSALDVSVQAAILNLLVELQRNQGVSYLFISHDLAVVRYVADKIAVMYLGQLVDVGPAALVFAAPHHPYTEALLSAIPSLDFAAPPRRIRLSGTIPSAADPPTGCRFHTRCPRVLGEVCRTQPPPWQDGDDGHRYRCHIPAGELRALQRKAAT
jgi:peptide/nickel transport system ATP-binding protein